MASVREIADHLNVSSATVSRVLNSRPGIAKQTRERVIEAAMQMGMGRHAGLKTTRYIGFVHPLGHFVGNMGSYHASLLGGVVACLGQDQYDLALIDPYRDKRTDESYAQFFMRKDLRGVLMQVRPENAHVIERIADEGFPMVTVASTSESPRVNWVVCDSGREFDKAVRYLARLGHRRIALAIRPELDYDHLARREGYRAAHLALGWELDPALEFDCFAEQPAGGSLIRQLFTLEQPPTAILFADPAPTQGALVACGELGIEVPGQLSVIGFDDGRTRYDRTPPYSAICQDAQRLGHEAASMLIKIIEGEEVGPQRLTLPALFEVHETTGPPAQKSPPKNKP